MSGLEGLLAGRVLVNRYRIEEVIGRGGFAAVYRADDLRLGRPVAVKVITLSAGDPALRDGLRERFQREARAAAGLPHHPNLVTVHDYGTDAALDLDFLVMELLRGEDLATYLAERGRPPLELAVAVLVDAAEGLAVGHRAGLVHRDVKPGNLFLAEPHGGEPFRVCVLDYGIARLQEEERTQTRLTQEGSAPLSPAYASPEQLRGEMDLSPASDVFSLGVVGYQLLTGERPFGAERRHRREGEAAPVRPVRELAPEVPPAVEAVVARALAERPEDRFTDAGEMAAALTAAVRDRGGDGERTVAAPSPAVLVAAPASSPPPRDEDATLIHPAGAASSPPPPRPGPPPRSASRAPAPRRVGMAGVLAGLLLLAGLAFGGWMLLGGEDGARSADTTAVETEDSLPARTDAAAAVTEPSPPATDAPDDGAASAPVEVEGEGEGTPASTGAPSPAPTAAGDSGAPSPAQPTTPAATPDPQPQPQTPSPRPQPPTNPSPAPQPTPQPPAPEPQPPAPTPEPFPQPQPPTPLPRPVVPSPLPAPRDTIRLRPAPARPLPGGTAATAPGTGAPAVHGTR